MIAFNMAELVLISLADADPSRRRALLKQLRQAALASVPLDDRRYKVTHIRGKRFTITIPGGEGAVDHNGALFEHDELEMPIISLMYNLAKTGNMAVVDSAGPTSTLLFDRADLSKLPAEFRRPKPAVCTSATHLAKMLGVSIKPSKTSPKQSKNQWSTDHTNRSRGRIPGLINNPKEPIIYIQTTPDENLQSLMNSFNRFLRAKKLKPPAGGGIWPEDFQLRLSTDDVFIPWKITGYEARPNSDHLVPTNIENWLKLAHAFARHTNRRTGTIQNGKTFLLNNRRLPLSKLESRRTPD
jgi:hypothetical protein